jgi:predicted amidohydrolase YtcJ
MKISAANVENPDGSLSSGRGWTRKPKLGTTDYGFAQYYKDHEKSDWKTIPILNRYGWRILGIHTAGDRSIDELFSAFEVANKEKPVAGRVAFDHVIMVRPEHIETAKRLGIMASAAPKYIAKSSAVLSKMYGADEVYKMSPVKSLLDAGVRVVMEGDDADNFWPMWNIEKFVTRADDGGKIWNNTERITRKQALYMYTNWAAYYTGDEKVLGTIEPGKLADFVILDGDFLKVPDEEISELKVLMTVVGGRVVFEKGM